MYTTSTGRTVCKADKTPQQRARPIQSSSRIALLYCSELTKIDIKAKQQNKLIQRKNKIQQ